jgi:hypothetical protein
MSITCSACGGERVAFRVPASLRADAPGDAPGATLCTNCLRVDDGDVAADAPTAVDWRPLPSGEAGVAMALLLGALDSLARNRAAITALVDHVEAAGGDVFLTLDRLVALAEAGEVDPAVDLDRRAAQLRSLLD